jgi:hypothetical protein
MIGIYFDTGPPSPQKVEAATTRSRLQQSPYRPAPGDEVLQKQRARQGWFASAGRPAL